MFGSGLGGEWNDLTPDAVFRGIIERQPTAVPEPTAWALVMGLGLLGLTGWRRWRLKELP